MSAVRNSKAVVVLVYDESDVDDYDVVNCPRRSRHRRRRCRFLAPRHSHSDDAVLTTTTTIVA